VPETLAVTISNICGFSHRLAVSARTTLDREPASPSERRAIYAAEIIS
jgi:hypothetical protein